MNAPPSQIVCGERDSGPFIGCFGRFEIEVLLALFVLTCRAHGDTWAPQPIGRIVDELTQLGSLPQGEAPSWILFMGMFGKVPDEPGAVAGGWLVVTNTENPRERVYDVTEFHQRLRDCGYVRGAA